jgi:hypothetical protein
MDEIKFTQCAVAFLDVLGFKGFIKAAERIDSPEFGQLCELLAVINRQLDFVQPIGGESTAGGQHLFPKDIGLQVLHISDSFVLSAPLFNDVHRSYSGLVAVSIKSIQLANQLLRTGFLVRGGLAVGNVYRTVSNIFGTGYQAAYATEETCANGPRILVHESAVEHFRSCRHFGYPLEELSILALEGREVILDTLTVHWSYLGDDPNVKSSETFSSYKRVIEQMLSELPSGRAREKWEWMAQYFNAKQRALAELRSVGSIQIGEFPLFRFGPLASQAETTFQEAFGPFMTRPLGRDRAED